MIRSKPSKYKILIIIGLLAIISCGNYLPKQHNFPEPVDTRSVIIQEQTKTSYEIDGVYASNEFDGARLNDFEKINDSTYRATITPENEPINESAYYCFEIWSDADRAIDLQLYYPGHEHRYVPKIRLEGNEAWTRMDTTLFDTIISPDLATLKIELSARHQHVCGQELSNSADNKFWSEGLSNDHQNVQLEVIGQSKKGRNILCLDINEPKIKSSPAIVIMSRLHPPEVSGYMAMQAFVAELLRDAPLSNAFRKKHRIIIYPMVNPDGVDMGHWRHNAGGIDLNRDWSHYRQQENKIVAEHCVRTIKKNKNKVLIGLDFHSTQEDILYTLSDNRKSTVYGFKDIWVQSLKDAIPGHDPDDAPYDLNTPISKGWFYLEFDAEGITYEVGDETDREFLKSKAGIAAREMMKLLVFR